MGSCLLLAVTNHLTQNIASIPFLWVVPLSLYLITFILCFDHPRWYRRGVFLAAVAVLLPAMAWYSDSLDLCTAAPLYAAGLFVCCMFCHGELTRLKPGPRYLTTFYLMMSVGGALGALLVGVAAPNLLSGYFELGITLDRVRGAALLPHALRPLVDRRRDARGGGGDRRPSPSINIGELPRQHARDACATSTAWCARATTRARCRSA